MAEEPDRVGRVGVYERPNRAVPVWVWLVAALLVLLAALWWLA